MSTAVHDNFPNLTLEFIENNESTRRSYPVDFHFKEVKFIDNTRAVLYGELTVSLKPFGVGAVEYNFNTQAFYRVYYSDKTTRSRKFNTKLHLIPYNKEQINRLLTFISNDLYSEVDYENQVNINGPTMNMKH